MLLSLGVVEVPRHALHEGLAGVQRIEKECSGCILPVAAHLPLALLPAPRTWAWAASPPACTSPSMRAISLAPSLMILLVRASASGGASSVDAASPNLPTR